MNKQTEEKEMTEITYCGNSKGFHHQLTQHKIGDYQFGLKRVDTMFTFVCEIQHADKVAEQIIEEGNEIVRIRKVIELEVV